MSAARRGVKVPTPTVVGRGHIAFLCGCAQHAFGALTAILAATPVATRLRTAILIPLYGATICVVAIPSAATADSAETAAAPLVQLGEKVFFDRRLSAGGKLSCASCHRPEQAFTDGKTTAEGVAGRRGTRNTPTLLDVAQRTSLTWDGRRHRLEDQVRVPFTHARELGMTTEAAVLTILRRDPQYRRDFAAVLRIADIDMEAVSSSLAAYVRTLESGSSAFDRFVSGDMGAVSESARRGYQLFRGAAGCAECHRMAGRGSSFTDDEFHRAGIGVAPIIDRLPEITRRVMATPPDQLETLIATTPEVAALGRFIVTRDPRDIAAYRTPGLRNVAITAPYMHDGSVATLREAVSREVYYRMQEQRRTVNVTLIDQDDLISFLETLTSDRFLPSKPASAR